MGKTDISPPISDRTCIAVMGFLSNPGTVRMGTRSISSRCFSDSSMWLRHWQSLTACSGEMAPSTATWISSIGVLQRLSTKGVTSNNSPGWANIYSVMERDDFPNTSLKTSLSLRFETVVINSALVPAPSLITKAVELVKKAENLGVGETLITTPSEKELFDAGIYL